MAWSGSSELLLGGGGGMSFDILVADDLLRELPFGRPLDKGPKSKEFSLGLYPKTENQTK